MKTFFAVLDQCFYAISASLRLPLRTLPCRFGTSFSVNGGLGGHVCVKMLDHDGMGGRGGRGMMAFLGEGPDEGY